MAPSTLQLTSQLRMMIYYHLDNDILHNALFLAGRMHALDSRNPDAIHLLSLCHFRSKQFKLAFDYGQAAARRGSHLGCSYVFAQACLRLDRWSEGIDALEKLRHAWDGKNDWTKPPDPSQRFIPDAPSILCLLGKLYEAGWKTDKAIDCWSAALKLNPFMWEAFESICNTGAHVNTSAVFKLHPEMTALLSARPDHSIPPRTEETYRGQLAETSLNRVSKTDVSAKDKQDPFSSALGPSEKSNDSAGLHARNARERERRATNLMPSTMAKAMETPTLPSETTAAYKQPNEPSRITYTMEPPHAPFRKPRSNQTGNIEINADPAKPRSLSTRNRDGSIEDGEQAESGPSHAAPMHKRTISGNAPSNAQSLSSSDLHIRRSRRLFNQIRPNSSKASSNAPVADDNQSEELKIAKATGTKGRTAATASTVGRVVSGNRKPVMQEQRDVHGARIRRPEAPTQTTSIRQTEKMVAKATGVTSDAEAVQWLLDLLARLGQGCYHLSQYDPEAALRCFNEIPTSQRDTPWVLARIGKSHFELNSYGEASKAFAKIRKVCPSSVLDMEVYSTILWHEKHETELAFLSHELLDVDRSSPEAWCTIGNAFSLQRDHDQALKCFKRATQLDASFAYGYTLQGHEHIANEKFDEAELAYRRAIRVDKRHYNGWYGLGKVYEKLGKIPQAETHYRAAASINPKNAVLYCCIGYIMEKRKQPQLALDQYDHASQLQPQASQALFRKARLLLNLRRHQDAIRSLNVLRDIAPNESNVHFMLGRAYARLKDKGLAVKHYTTAMNLDPKAAPYLKEQMEALDEEDDDFDEDEDEEMT